MSKTTQKIKTPKKSDPFRKLKHIAYIQTQLPEDGVTLSTFILFVKGWLARRTGRLTKDPIWDLYTKEELLVEYFSYKFSESEAFRSEFEAQMRGSKGVVDEFSAWADKQMKEEKEIVGDTLGSAEEKISFSPTDVLGDE